LRIGEGGLQNKAMHDFAPSIADEGGRRCHRIQDWIDESFASGSMADGLFYLTFQPDPDTCEVHLKTDSDIPGVALLQAFNEAWNRHDIDALMSMMASDCVFHAVAGPDELGRSFVGREAVREGFELAWKTCPDAQWTDGVHFVAGDRGVSESTFRGTRAADGMRIEARMVDVFTFQGGRIAVKNAFRKDRPAFKP
jgi:ketosteroid isomerase-like protein